MRSTTFLGTCKEEKACVKKRPKNQERPNCADDILNSHVWRIQAAIASADSQHNMFQTFSTVMTVYHQYKTENRSNQRLAAMSKECVFFLEGGHFGRFLQCGDVPKCASAPLEA